MYPETDIQSIPISNTTMLDSLSHRIPEPWDVDDKYTCQETRYEQKACRTDI